MKVTAGSYLREYYNNENEPGSSVTVSFGNLYSRELRKVIVDLLLPATVNERKASSLQP